MARWQCISCGYIYDEAKGYAPDNLAPGTRFEDIRSDWRCPDCGLPKKFFRQLTSDSEATTPDGKDESGILDILDM